MMFDFINGELVEVESDYVVIEQGSIGYLVFSPNTQRFLPLIHQTIKIFTHLYVREDAFLLYGFYSKEERLLFRKLIEVTGIGPKIAIGILSQTTPEVLVHAILQENLTVLTDLPGIGKKTAQRIVIELKDRLKNFSFTSDRPTNIQFETHHMKHSHELPFSEDAREALLSLGYIPKEIERAFHTITEKKITIISLDQLIKLGLNELMRA